MINTSGFCHECRMVVANGDPEKIVLANGEVYHARCCLPVSLIKIWRSANDFFRWCRCTRVEQDFHSLTPMARNFSELRALIGMCWQDAYGRLANPSSEGYRYRAYRHQASASFGFDIVTGEAIRQPTGNVVLLRQTG